MVPIFIAGRVVITEKKLDTEILRNTLALGLHAIGLSALIMLSVANVRADTVHLGD